MKTIETENMSLGLIGYRGSGKTTVGKMLAERLKQEFVDVDERVMRRAGKSIKAIFEQAGEKAFRDLESQAVGEACILQSTIVSFGGGALDRAENQLAVSQSKLRLIYLQCQPPELLRRIQNDPLTASARPNLTSLGGGVSEIEAVLDRREPIWKRMVFATIDVTRLSPEEVVNRILAGN